MTAADHSEIATLRIELLDTDPLIWRQVEVPTSITLKGLHDVVQAAMGWDDQHLWEFRIGRQVYGQPMRGESWGADPILSAAKVLLGEILKPRKTVIDYIYDMGDSWEHRLTLTDVRPGAPDTAYPRYIAGEQAAPPEDCGGVPGFYASLEALADPNHPDHEDVADWLEGYDPNAINEPALKRAVGRIASRKRPAKKA
jgi:hypothetical protein